MRRRYWMILACVTAALIASGCGKFGSLEEPKNTTADTDANKRGTVTTKPFDAAAKETAGCGEVEDIKDASHTHVDTGTSVKYSDNPPASGNHWSYEKAPRPYGVYSEEIRAEEYVHNLEHGHIVIAYKGISKKEKKSLLAQRKKAPYHLLVTPRSKNPKDGVYYITWRHRMYCKHPSAPGLQYFIDRLIDSGRELIMSDPPAKKGD